MDNFGGDIGYSVVIKTSKKRRSNLNRRPVNGSESSLDYRDSVSLSSTPSYSNLLDPEAVQNSSDENGLFGDNPAADSTKPVIDGHLHSEKPGEASDVIGNEKRVKRVKLKVGGVTRTIHTVSESGGSSVVAGTHSDDYYPPRKLNRQESLDYVSEKRGLRGVPWKDFSRTGFSLGKIDTPRVDMPDGSVKQASKHGRSYKFKSVSDNYMSDEVYDDEEDDEIRYLQKLKTSRIASLYDIRSEDETKGKKLRKISRVMNTNTYDMGMEDYSFSRSEKDSRKSKLVREFGETGYMDEEESASDGEMIITENRKPRTDSSRSESSITTRRRAIETGRDNSPTFIQFPDGLPPAPPRKQKEQLSEMEQQLKRAEAAQRRKMQNEKAARESQDEAIRKILGQDSSRKKREDKIKKRQKELAEERSSNFATVPPDVVRWVMGPTGTIVTFPHEIGLPSIFEPKSCSYPPPREKCAGPSCTNAYKYRDSKSNLPLCSLHCYKAIHQKSQSLSAC